jgi:hypothetical protein
MLATVLALPCAGLIVSSMFTESEAPAKAMAILKGDPDGTSGAEVEANIKQVRFV